MAPYFGGQTCPTQRPTSPRFQVSNAGFDRVQQTVAATLDTGQIISAVTFIALPGNPWDLGTPKAKDLAEQIRSACGPSGSSVDYFRHLRWASQCLGAADDHIESIAFQLTLLGCEVDMNDATTGLQIEKALLPWHPLTR